MTESTRKPSAQRQESTRTHGERNRQTTNRQTASRRGMAVKAILAGASPEQLSGLLGRDGAGIPNSVLLDLISRERPVVDREPRPLPKPAAAEPFVWDGPFGTLETGAAEALPAGAFTAEGGSLGGAGGPGASGPVPG